MTIVDGLLLHKIPLTPSDISTIVTAGNSSFQKHSKEANGELTILSGHA